MKIILRFCVFTGLVLLGISSSAQQDPQFTFNTFNRLYPNPGVAGANGSICATMLGREQWVGFEGRPQTYLFSLHGPVKLVHGGVGLVATRDVLGQVENTSLKLSYAFRKSIGPGELGLGVGLGMLNGVFGNDWKVIGGQADVIADPNIPENGGSFSSFDVDFGAYYSTSDLYAGISVMHLPAQAPKSSAKDFAYKIDRHYYLMAGYKFPSFLSPSIDFYPSVFVKTDGAAAQVSLNGLAYYNNLFWAGITYRLQDALGPMVGVDYQMPGRGLAGGLLKIGYAHDVTTSQLRAGVVAGGSQGSHEILLNYCFTISKTPKVSRHKTVRFL